MELKNSSSEAEKWCINELLYPYHGFWFMLKHINSTKTILKHFTPNPNDVILASFRKTGTTWLKALLHSIIYNSPNSLMSTHPQQLVPSLESRIYLHGHTPLDSQQVPGTRVFGTHLPYQIIGDILGSSSCKVHHSQLINLSKSYTDDPLLQQVVYLTRNPKDVLVSTWNFMQATPAFQEDPWELETAVDQFCKGVVPFGPYYEHVLSYREESLARADQVLFVTYEELKEDPKQHVVRLAQFLGCPLGGHTHTNTAEEIVQICSFEKLSNHQVNNSDDFLDMTPFPKKSFFRKGEVGDHKNYLTTDMINKIDAVTRDKFHGAGFMYGV